MTMFGVFAGGLAVARYGLLRAMVIGAFAGPLSNLLFIWLAMQRHSLCRAVRRHRPRQRRGRLRRHLPDRLHVEPDVGRVHRHAVRALFLALRDSRPPDRVAIGAHRRERRASRRCGRSAVRSEGCLSRVRRRRISPPRSNDRASRPRRWAPATWSSSPIPRSSVCSRWRSDFCYCAGLVTRRRTPEERTVGAVGRSSEATLTVFGELSLALW